MFTCLWGDFPVTVINYQRIVFYKILIKYFNWSIGEGQMNFSSRVSLSALWWHGELMLNKKISVMVHVNLQWVDELSGVQ
jgi:hypothetical protein